MLTDQDRAYMELALSLAEKGRGATSPNPMVGAVVVRDGVIVGKGWHKRAGGDHAEVIALREAGDRARGATLYVTLEPCSHQGKTPPCTGPILSSGISRVVAAMTDPNPRVCGGGFACLRDGGIEIETGLLEDRASKLNEAYLKHIRTGLPFLTLKLAVTLDGKIAAKDRSGGWFTGIEARARVHAMRAWSDAVMVGAGTILADDPLLTVREVEGKNPVRVILDPRLRTSPGSRVYHGGGAIVFAADSAAIDVLNAAGVEVIRAPAPDGRIDLNGVLKVLGSRGMTSVLCEGGRTVATSILRERIADRVAFFVAPKILGAGLDAIGDIGIESMDTALALRDIEIEALGHDVLITGYPDYR
jgi:diaminohydroxyphosphoribosylaminopyrimidine deaminase / 5-amino-6-(5-phosphoribosylamino)uracil reductase